MLVFREKPDNHLFFEFVCPFVHQTPCRHAQHMSKRINDALKTHFRTHGHKKERQADKDMGKTDGQGDRDCFYPKLDLGSMKKHVL